jgi:CheY-like chemotaxis protein/uncharacterized metal-binding protein
MAKLLIVEDDESQRLLYEEELQEEGYEVVLAKNGKEALKSLEESLIDLIILDIRMPEMNGIGALGKIASRYKKTPVILHTAYPEYRNQFIALLADDFVLKSSDLSLLKKTVKELLEGKNRVKGETNMAEEQKHWQEGMKTHENIIFSCFGGLSNTGITSALASLEAVKELGLEKVAIGCLGALPEKIPPVMGKTKAAKKVVTVDGCPFECSKKITEKAGFKVTKSIVLVRDIGMKKKALHEDIGQNIKGLMEYVSQDDVKKAKDLIVKAILED